MIAGAHFGVLRKRALVPALVILAGASLGCAPLPCSRLLDAAGSSITKTDATEQSVRLAESEDLGEATSVSAGENHSAKQAPRKLLSWQIGGVTGGSGGNGQDRQEAQSGSTTEETPIKTDRPTFTPSSSTVGANVIQLETGYTFTHSHIFGATVENHSYPEANLRIGILADWLEGRIGQNFVSTNTAAQGSSTSETGATDLLLGIKLGLAQQQAYLPEAAVILQMSVPTGSSFLTGKEVLPGIIAIFGWDIIKNSLSASGSLSANRALDGARHFYSQLAESFVLNWSLTRRLDVFAESYALNPSGAIASATGPHPFSDTGMTFKVTPNLQLDTRAGMGLNHHADQFFASLGISARY